MYKNQLQELAQRSCFNLPSYTCIREGPDHAPRFKAVVVFNGESFDSPHFFSTLRQAEHAAAEVALNSLSSRGPSHSLAARILDETGVYKNLLQEISQRVGAPLPQYTTFRSGLGHQPVFTGTVELAGITFTGEAAKNKKQAEKNAALAAWASLKQLAQDQSSGSSSSEAEQHTSDEMEQITIARALASYRSRERITNSTPPVPFPQKFSMSYFRPSSPQRNPAPTSKILPLICPRRSHHSIRQQHQRMTTVVGPPDTSAAILGSRGLDTRPYQFPIRRPYIPIRNMSHGIAPPVTIRTAVPCYSAPPGTAPPPQSSEVGSGGPPPPVTIRTAVPCYSAPSVGPAQPSPSLKFGGGPPPVRIRTAVPCYSGTAPPSSEVGGGSTTTTPPPPPPAVRIVPSVQIRPVHAASPSIRKDDDLGAAASLERWMTSIRMCDGAEMGEKKIKSDAEVGTVDQDRIIMAVKEKEVVMLKEKSGEVVEGRGGGGSERRTIEEKLEQLNVR